MLQPKKTRKFIDRKRDNPVTFRLVSRSQHDPLVADENAPQKVLLEVDSNAKSKVSFLKQVKRVVKLSS